MVILNSSRLVDQVIQCIEGAVTPCNSIFTTTCLACNAWKCDDNNIASCWKKMGKKMVHASNRQERGKRWYTRQTEKSGKSWLPQSPVRDFRKFPTRIPFVFQPKFPFFFVWSIYKHPKKKHFYFVYNTACNDFVNFEKAYFPSWKNT